MVDPTGISGNLTGYAVTKLLNELILQITNTLYYQRYCDALSDLLKSIQPLVSGAEAAVGPPRDQYTVTEEVSAGTISTGTGEVKKWLGDQQRVLVEAHETVEKCKTTSPYNVFSRNKMAREILNIGEKINKTSMIHAPFAAINIAAETLETVRAANRLFAEQFVQLRHDLNAKAVGGTTEVILQMEGIQPAQAFQEIRMRTNTFAAGVYRDSGQASSSSSSSTSSGSHENDHEDEGSSYTLRPVPEKTFGMDVPLSKLRDLLIGEIPKMQWVGVYGKGGIGKTLLTEQAFNSEVVQDHFQQKSFWLTVGRNPSIERLQQKLCADLKLRINFTESREEIKTRLFNELRGKKVLLVLDDVWEDKGTSLLDLFGDITSGCETGSKILVTTRNIEVLEKKHAQDISTVRMERLSDSDSWELFCEFAFAGVDNVPHSLDTLGRAVADECKGLPLALKVIAGAQAGQRSIEQWHRALKKLKEAEALNKDHEVQLYKRLQLSYDALDSLEPDSRHRHRLQKCFIYFAGYREDQDVDMEKLVSLWAGEKLLEAHVVEADNDPALDGKYLLGMLIGRSLIDLQKADWSHSINSRQLKCRVHDVLRDLARYLIRNNEAPIKCLFRAGEELKQFPNTWLTKPTCPRILGDRPRYLTNDATHLSLNDNLLELLPTKLKAPKLEVLLLANNGNTLVPQTKLVISPGFFESFSKLKVLDLENTRIDVLPESVKNLRNLIYLDLSFTNLLKLPRGLRKLQKLEYLSLQNCNDLQSWPFDISSLKSLSSLNTRGCGDIWKPNLGSRQCNRFFPTHHDSLDSLCSLTALRNLSISGDRDHLPSKMSSLVNLRHLSIFLNNLKELPSGLQPSKLQYFSLDNCRALSELPPWMDSLAQLASLNLAFCGNLKSLPNLHKLQELQKLDLGFCKGLLELPLGFTSTGAFPALKELYIQNCVGLREFPTIEQGAFPELMILKFTGCVFQTLPGSLSLLPELVTLDLNLCNRLGNLDDCFDLRVERHTTDQTSNQQLHSVPYFTKLRDLGLKGLPLKNLPCGLAACPALKTIDLRNTHDVTIPESLQSLQAEGKLVINQ